MRIDTAWIYEPFVDNKYQLSQNQISDIAKTMKTKEDILALDFPVHILVAIELEWKSKIIPLEKLYNRFDDKKILCLLCGRSFSYCVNADQDKFYYCFYKKCPNYRQMMLRTIKGLFCTPNLHERATPFEGPRRHSCGWFWNSQWPNNAMIDSLLTKILRYTNKHGTTEETNHFAQRLKFIKLMKPNIKEQSITLC